MWTGYTRVLMEGSEKCKIQLVNEDGSLFAQTTIKDDNWEAFVQRTIDSSRFFALLLVNEQTGQRANIGLQFPERNDSFDFTGALEQFKKYFRQDKGTFDSVNLLAEAPKQDFSLKAGEKLTVNIKGISTSSQSNTGTKGGGLKKLAMPTKNKPSSNVDFT